jgi:hypothetical protein
MPKNYNLEIYENSYINDPHQIESDIPFPPIHVGDTIDSYSLPKNDAGWQFTKNELDIIKVIDITHFIYNGGNNPQFQTRILVKLETRVDKFY